MPGSVRFSSSSPTCGASLSSSSVLLSRLESSAPPGGIRWISASAHPDVPDAEPARGAPLTDDHPRLLAYVSPSTTRQFVSVSNAQAYIKSWQARQNRLDCRHAGSAPSPCLPCEALRGGQWCVAYRIAASEGPVTPQTEARTASSETAIKWWCFTLAPLPVEQLRWCRIALGSLLSLSTRDGVTPLHHQETLPFDSRSRLLCDVLVTPLYLCCQSACIISLPRRVDREPWSLGGDGVVTSFGNAMAADALWAELNELLRSRPTCGALVYALRQVQQHHLPPLPWIDNAQPHALDGWEAGVAPALFGQPVSADVHVTVAEEGATLPLPERGVEPLATWTAMIGEALFARWPRFASQVVMCNGVASSAQRHRAALLETCLASAALSSAEEELMVRRLGAARLLLDSLRPVPYATGAVRIPSCGSIVVDVVDVVLAYDEAAPWNHSADAHDSLAHPSLQRPRLSRGAVRRVVTSAHLAAQWQPRVPQITSSLEDPLWQPELDYLRLPWSLAHREHECAFVRPHQTSGTHTSSSKGATVESTSSSLAPSAAPPLVRLAELDNAMQILGFEAEQQAELHALACGILLLSDVAFVPSKEQRSALAGRATCSIAALEMAARQLSLPAEELRSLLTTVESGGGGDRGDASPVTTHPLNCAGAAQMRMTLIASIGGFLVGRLLQLVNSAVAGYPTVALRSMADGAARHAPPPSGRSPAPLSLSLVVMGEAEWVAESLEATKQPSHPVASTTAHDDCCVGDEVGGFRAWFHAFLHCHVALALQSKLVHSVQYEASQEGVGREMAMWRDKMAVVSPGASEMDCDGAAQALEVAQGMWEVPSTSRCGSRSQGPSYYPAPVHRRLRAADSPLLILRKVAGALESVLSRCCSADTSAALLLGSREAIQEELRAHLNPLVEDTPRHENATAAAEETEAVAMCAWESAELGRGSIHDGGVDTIFRLSFRCGLYLPPLRLSLRRLAAELFDAARWRALSSTRAMRRACRTLGRRWGTTLGVEGPKLSGAATTAQPEGQERWAEHQGRPQAFLMNAATLSSSSLHNALVCATGLYTVDPPEVDSSTTAAMKSLTITPHFLTVIHTVPIREAPAVDPSHLPFLEPSPATNSLLTQPSQKSTTTMDDAITTYLLTRQPLLLALFFWSRLCHSHVCPVPTFATKFAVPLLLSAAWWPQRQHVGVHEALGQDDSTIEMKSSTRGTTPQWVEHVWGGAPSEALHGLRAWFHRIERGQRARVVDSGERAKGLLSRIQHLRSQARYRALCALAVEELARCDDDTTTGEGEGEEGGDILVGVSVVFLTSSATAVLCRCRAALYEAVARHLQAVSRGYRERRTLGHLGDRTHRKIPAHSFKADSTGEPPLDRYHELERLDKERDKALARTALLRQQDWEASLRHLSLAVGPLQQEWTRALETLETELASAVAELNAHELQRRAAEDAAKEEAHLEFRVFTEAWREVWRGKAEEVRQRNDLRATQRQQRRGASRGSLRSARVSYPGIEGEVQLATAAARHLSYLKREAAQVAEGAVLSRLVRASRWQDARWQVRHLQQRETRALQLASRQERCNTENNSDASRLQRVMVPTSMERPLHACGSRLHHLHEAQQIGVPQFCCEGSRGEDTDTSRKQHRRDTAADLASSPFPSSSTPGDHYPSGSVMSIERTRTSRTADAAEWAVQRDLMALWESSRMTFPL